MAIKHFWKWMEYEMKSIRMIRACCVFLLVGLWVGCQTGAPPQPEAVTLSKSPQALGSVDTAGGDICSKGGLCLNVPAGAVDAATTLKAHIAADTQEGAVGPVYELTADKETFLKAISLRLPVPAGAEKDELEVVFWKDGGWVAVPTTATADGKARIGSTDHLSRWSMRRKTPTSGCASDADCGRGQQCVRGSCQSTPPCTPSPEICDGKDNNCDGQIDEGCVPCRPTGNCGAGKSCVNGYCAPTPGCSSDADCARGEQCKSGKCTPQTPTTACRSNADCSRGEVCQSGQCVAAPASCSSDSDCAAGQVCQSGQCAAAPASCRSDSDCTRGEQCVSGVCQTSSSCASGQQLCGRTCVDLLNDTANCGACGQVCQRGESCSGGRCFKAPASCSSNADCAAGQVCQSGQCTAAPASCRSDSDCTRGEQCVSGVCKSGGSCSPTPEVCDGIDNDCDGQIDNGVTRSCYTGPRGTSGVGACKSGTQSCRAGSWSACVGEVLPSREVCNRLDDDCDGQIDENCSATSCSSDSDCASGQLCKSGQCAAAPASCSSDSDCASGESCVSGVCQASSSCPGGQQLCGRTCVDLLNDAANCGSCGSACQRGEACGRGICYKSSSGCSSNADCAAGQSCVSGLCQ